MIRRAILTIAIFCAFASPAFAENSPEADAKAIPTSIHQVVTGGFWEHGKDEGHYRVVVIAGGFEHVSHRLFIQWIVIDQDNHDLKITRTVAVKEVHDLSGVVSELKPQFNPKGPLIVTLTLNGRDNVKRKRTITATADGRYTIK